MGFAYIYLSSMHIAVNIHGVDGEKGLLRIPSGRPTVAFDPQGVVFAVATAQNALRLFDSRQFDKVLMIGHCCNLIHILGPF